MVCAIARYVGLDDSVRLTLALSLCPTPRGGTSTWTLNPLLCPGAWLVAALRPRAGEVTGAILVRLFGEPEPAQGQVQRVRPRGGVIGVRSQQAVLRFSPIFSGPIPGLAIVHGYALRTHNMGLRRINSALQGMSHLFP